MARSSATAPTTPRAAALRPAIRPNTAPDSVLPQALAWAPRVDGGLRRRWLSTSTARLAPEQRHQRTPVDALGPEFLERRFGPSVRLSFSAFMLLLAVLVKISVSLWAAAVVLEGLIPDVSLGTHFFQDLMEAHIHPLNLNLDDPDGIFRRDFFYETPNHLADILPAETGLQAALRLVRVEDFRPGWRLSLVMNDEVGKAVAYLRKS